MPKPCQTPMTNGLEDKEGAPPGEATLRSHKEEGLPMGDPPRLSVLS
jgi:hypothetical protein